MVEIVYCKGVYDKHRRKFIAGNDTVVCTGKVLSEDSKYYTVFTATGNKRIHKRNIVSVKELG